MSATNSIPGTSDTHTPRMLGFAPDSTVDVREIDSTNWEVLRALTYHGNIDDFVVPENERTDFASVPRVFAWFLPRYGRYTKAAILHDHLWRVAVPNGLSRLDADGIFRQAMRELGVPFLRRWIMWAAVRWGALTKPDGRRDWWKEAWRVLLVSLVALPITLPAVLVIMITLPVFYLVELLVWLPLTITHKLRVRAGKSAKIVNAPALRWKL
jgi:hypothetical protein